MVGLSGCTAHANLTLADGLWTEVKPAMSVSQADEELKDKPSSLCSCGRRRLPVTEEQLCENLRERREPQSDANP